MIYGNTSIWQIFFFKDLSYFFNWIFHDTVVRSFFFQTQKENKTAKPNNRNLEFSKKKTAHS